MASQDKRRRRFETKRSLAEPTKTPPDDDTPDEFVDPEWFRELQQSQQQEQTR